jgi:hypothetical protein
MIESLHVWLQSGIFATFILIADARRAGNGDIISDQTGFSGRRGGLARILL